MSAHSRYRTERNYCTIISSMQILSGGSLIKMQTNKRKQHKRSRQTQRPHHLHHGWLKRGEARRQRAWSIIHLISLQSITLHVLYITWPATGHASLSSYSALLESKRLPAIHHIKLMHRQWHEQGSKGTDEKTKAHTHADSSWNRHTHDVWLLPVPSEQSHM